MARSIILVLTLALAGYLAYWTVLHALKDGVTFFVILSLLVLALLGVGVVGALLSGQRDE